MDGCVLFAIETLGNEAQGGCELRAGGKVGAAVGQFKTMSDLLVGLRGDLLHRFTTHPRDSRRSGNKRDGLRTGRS